MVPQALPSLLILLRTVIPVLAGGADRVNVTVFIESHCPDSQDFVVDQLYPVWNDLKDIMTFNLNAYGKASDEPFGGSYAFECQHGPEECEANMILTCAKQYIPSEERFLAFSSCILSQLSETTRTRKRLRRHFMARIRHTKKASPSRCAKEAGEELANIENCYKSVEGQKLLHGVGVLQRTLIPPLNFVPWILINNEYSQQQLQASMHDLRKVVCEAYEGERPDACTQTISS